MASETVTLVLDGEPSLDDFATAIGGLRDLLRGLTKLADHGSVGWTIDALEKGSAVVTCRGVAADDEAVHEVAELYLAAANGVRRGEDFPEDVQRPVGRIYQLRGERVPSIRFETADDDVTIGTEETVAAAYPVPTDIPGAYGAVEGRIQTLGSRGGLRFTLYDLIDDKAVSCYLQKGADDSRMRDAWNHVARVEGWIKRDPTGRPQTIRRIRNVTLLSPGTSGGWRDAIGVLHNVGRDEPAEDTIRRVRDAWR